MSNFEFITVLLSITFALAIANLLAGMLQALLKGELTDTHLAWSILVGNILLVNWWVFFGWNDPADVVYWGSDARQAAISASVVTDR